MTTAEKAELDLMDLCSEIRRLRLSLIQNGRGQVSMAYADFALLQKIIQMAEDMGP